MIRYLNTTLSGKVETLGEIDSKDFAGGRQFRDEIRRLCKEYQLSGHGYVYPSSRSTKAWKDR